MQRIGRLVDRAICRSSRRWCVVIVLRESWFQLGDISEVRLVIVLPESWFQLGDISEVRLVIVLPESWFQLGDISEVRLVIVLPESWFQLGDISEVRLVIVLSESWFQLGDISEVRLVKNFKGKSKGFAYIEFTDEVFVSPSCQNILWFVFIISFCLFKC